MMKVSAFMMIAVSLVVGEIRSPGNSRRAEQILWFQQCINETEIPVTLLDAHTTNQRREWCFMACYLEKAGMMKDGKLEDREKVCDSFVDDLNDLAAIFKPKEGRTHRQLAEKCYDEANVKTEKCEIAGTAGICLRQGMEFKYPSSDRR